jgi:hypothetical protein
MGRHPKPFTTVDLEMKEAPALLVELGSIAIRQSRRFASCGRLTLRARRAGSAAGAGMFAFPWSIGMVSQTQPQSSQGAHSCRTCDIL